MADAPIPQIPARLATDGGAPIRPDAADATPKPNRTDPPPPLAPVPGIPLPPKPPRTDNAGAKPLEPGHVAATEATRLAPPDAKPPLPPSPPPVGRLATEGGLPEIKPVPGIPPPPPPEVKPVPQPEIKPVPGVPPPEKPSAISAAKDKMADAVESVKSYMTVDKVKMGLGAGFILVHVAVGVLAYFGLKYPSVELPPGF